MKNIILLLIILGALCWLGVLTPEAIGGAITGIGRAIGSIFTSIG